MRFRFALRAVLLLLIVSLSASAQYPTQWGRPTPPQTGACFYKDANFGGQYFCLKLGQNWSSMPSGFNDKISSIRLFRGAQVRIFADSNYGGANNRISRDVTNLQNLRLRNDPSRTWNDRISSIAVYRSNDAWDRGHP
jgi:Peptidase inhibitor family I36